jgi:hypothetical protein
VDLNQGIKVVMLSDPFGLLTNLENMSLDTFTLLRGSAEEEYHLFGNIWFLLENVGPTVE